MAPIAIQERSVAKAVVVVQTTAAVVQTAVPKGIIGVVARLDMLHRRVPIVAREYTFPSMHH